MTYLSAKSQNIIDHKMFLELAQKGFFRHGISKDFNGFGDGFQALCEAHIDIGKRFYNPSLILSINAHIWGGIFPLIYFGTNEQRNIYLKEALDGKIIGGHAITESVAGSHIYGIESRILDEQNDVFLISGSKKYITNVPIADYLIVYVKDNLGLSAFIVLKKDLNVQFIPQTSSMSCFSESPIGEVVLNNCWIPKNRLLGLRGSGAQILQVCLELERSFIFAGIIGVMEWQFENVKTFANKRNINNHALSSYQSIRHKIVDIYFRLQNSKILVSKCALMKDGDQSITMLSTVIKTIVSDLFIQNTTDVIHIMAALGFEDKVHSKIIHDALASKIIAGSTEIQKNIAAALLGLRDK